MSSQGSPKTTERLRMRPWLEQRLEQGDTPGLEWLDKERGTFRIAWKHAARHGWDKDKDACLFKDWAVHTCKYDPTKGDKPRPKTWKANFRCALNSLPDIQELSKLSNRKGNNAFKVYKLMPRKQIDRKKKLSNQTKYRRNSTRINDRSSKNLNSHKELSSPIHHDSDTQCLRPRTRSMSRDATRKQGYTTTKADFEHDGDIQIKLEIDPEEIKSYEQSNYPTPPRSRGDSPADSTTYRQSPTNAVNGFVPPSIPSSVLSPVTVSMTTLPSPTSTNISHSNGLDENCNEQTMHIDDDGSVSGAPSDEELVEMVHEMEHDSDPNSPMNAVSDEFLQTLQPDSTSSWTESTEGSNTYLKNDTVSTTVSSLLETSNALTTLDTNAALQLTETWIEQIGCNQEVTTEEIPQLTEIPRPTYIKEPGIGYFLDEPTRNYLAHFTSLQDYCGV